jgi:hypothetical protein
MPNRRPRGARWYTVRSELTTRGARWYTVRSELTTTNPGKAPKPEPPRTVSNGSNMMSYIGCFLFGAFFLVMTAQTSGSSLNARLNQTLGWIQGWAPFSYVLIVMMLAAGVVSIWSIFTWPKEERPDQLAECQQTIVIQESAPEEEAPAAPAEA